MPPLQGRGFQDLGWDQTNVAEPLGQWEKGGRRGQERLGSAWARGYRDDFEAFQGFGRWMEMWKF